MSNKASPTLIGVFTLVGLLLAGGAVVTFGAGKLFEKSSNILLHFDQSANGLSVGSEVRFGGVRIGRVGSIKVLYDPQGNRKIIPVVVELSEKDLKDVGSASGEKLDFATESGVKNAVAFGLRAKMKQQSFLTGQLYVEFDIVPEIPGFIYLPEGKPRYPMVPTMGTEIDELIAGVADGLKKFNALDLESAMNEFRVVLATTNSQIAALNMEKINENIVGITSDIRTFAGNEKLASALDSLDEALKGIEVLTKKGNEKLDPLVNDLEKVMQQANAGLLKIDQAVAGIAKVTNPRAPTLMRLHNALVEVERSSRAIKELATDLKRNPDALLRGRNHEP